MEVTVAKPVAPDWFDLLDEAVAAPGELAAAHQFFHTYSLCNKWMASQQLRRLGLPLMPINTFKGWLNAKRPVMKGQKASIALVMPVPVSRKKAEEAEDEEKKTQVFHKFMLRNYWFHLQQTDGEEYIVEERATDWKLDYALDILEITEEPFKAKSVSDIRLGYAEGQCFAISPVHENPMYNRIRQMAHIVLGHTGTTLRKNVPVDSTSQALELGGARALQPKLAQRAFSAADKILNAGRC